MPITFKTLLEFVKSHSARSTSINGVEVVHTTHGEERNGERTPHMTPEKWHTFHSRVIAKSDHYSRMLPDGNHEVLFHSPSMDHAVVYNIHKHQGKTKQIRVITTLPKGKSRPKEGTKKIVVESKEILYIDLDQD